MAESNVMQFRATDEGVAFVAGLMAAHDASRTDVLRAMFKVASQFPDRIAAVLAGTELGSSRAEAVAAATAPCDDFFTGPSGIAGMRAAAKGR